MAHRRSSLLSRPSCRSTAQLASLVAFLLLLVVQPATAEAPVADVEQIRFGQHEQTTRVVLDMSGPVPFRVHTVANPYRVLVDFPALTWRPATQTGAGRGLISLFQFGDFEGTHRLVLHSDGPVRVQRAFVLPGDRGSRFVLDVERTSDSAFRAGADQVTAGILNPQEAPTPSVAEAAAQGRRQGQIVVVLDPGHGGVDPGAVGVGNIYEKVVVLQTARRLRDVLAATGRYKVVMTRDGDRFLPLRRRVQVARDANADLFISLHADSVARGRVQGSSIYTLSETASDREAARLARQENKADVLAGIDLAPERDDVTNILIDLAQRETMNSGRNFANLFVGEMQSRGLQMVGRPHRSAGFAVLKAPDVPSVLIELGFLSDAEEARKLATPQHQQALANSIAATVDRYFNTVLVAERP